jgi:nitrogen fixation protein NifB
MDASTSAPVLAVLPANRPSACRPDASSSCKELPADVAARIRTHPCYGEDAHHHFARIHLPVAPACNIQCHYCNRRFDCASESRPGLTSERLSPEQALARVRSVARDVPELAVVGIAGPGDPLANPAATFRTLKLVRSALPDLTLCLSTNGLALPDHVDALAALGVGHVTVTVNMVDPVVGERIYPWVYFQGKRHRGPEASALLSSRQLDGIRRAVALGMLVKVNTVLIPGVNDSHLPEVAARVRQLGAFIHNVIPLLVAPGHGTFYAKVGQRGPTDAELERARAACEGSRLLRHCRSCRADAIGRLGERRTATPLPEGPAPVDLPGARAVYRAVVERQWVHAARARDEALARVRAAPPGVVARVAVATRGGGMVNAHFGHAEEFHVYDVDRAGARLVGVRRIERYCIGGEADDDALPGALRALEGCAAVLVARIGRCPSASLRAAGVEPVTTFAHEPVEAAVLSWFSEHVERDGARHAPHGRHRGSP